MLRQSACLQAVRKAAVALDSSITSFSTTRLAHFAHHAQISKDKASADATKGARLDKIAAIVNEINGKIRTKKEILAPKIKALKEARAAAEELTLQRDAAGASYEAAAAKAQTSVAPLESEVAAMRRAVEEVWELIDLLLSSVVFSEHTWRFTGSSYWAWDFQTAHDAGCWAERARAQVSLVCRRNPLQPGQCQGAVAVSTAPLLGGWFRWIGLIAHKPALI